MTSSIHLSSGFILKVMVDYSSSRNRTSIDNFLPIKWENFSQPNTCEMFESEDVEPARSAITTVSLATVAGLLLLLTACFIAWYRSPRLRVKDLPIATGGVSFLLGHLNLVCSVGLEEQARKWFAGNYKMPLLTYFHGRTPVVLIKDPNAAKQLLKVTNERSNMDVVFGTPLTLATANGDEWKRLRKAAMSKMFAIAKESRPILQARSQDLRNQLLDNQNKSSVEMVHAFRASSLDIMVKLFFDIELNLTKGENASLLENGELMSDRQLEGFSSTFVQWISSIFRVNAEYIVSLTNMFKSRSTSLSCLIESELKERKHSSRTEDEKVWFDWWLGNFGPSVSKVTAYAFIIASIDNTATSLGAFFYYMAENPSIQEKLFAELQAKVFSQDIHDSAELASALRSCQYLDWCIMESMRKFSLVPFYGRVTTKDTQVDKYTIPKGTHCMIASDLLHHNPSEWPQPEVFRPERFDPSSQEHKNRNQFSFLPLGFGRECAAKVLVREQMRMTISALLESFEFRVDAPKHPHGMECKAAISKIQVGGVHLILSRRE